MSAPPRKGWCPGALRAMPAKDGLLVRLRITGGIITASTAMALAELAERCGSGLFDLSTRGNLQLRGVRETSLPMLQDGLLALGLIDDDAAAEAVRNVVASPLAGLQEGPDIRFVTRALEDRLVADPRLHDLPGKFCFLIDDGHPPSLAGLSADVRFDWTGHDFAIGLGGDASDALPIGHCTEADLVSESARIAIVFLERFAADVAVRRMRDVGRSDLRAAFSASPRPGPARRMRQAVGAADLVGHHTLAARKSAVGNACLGLAAPFGRLDTAMMRAAAAVAAATPFGELRLTPWRVILVPGASLQTTDVAGFVTDPADPRLAVAACVGIDGCANATIDIRLDAARLARDLGLRANDGITVHVSGCGKGCAKATPTPFTLVGRDGRYDVVRNGRAGDAPQHCGLDRDGVRRMLTTELAGAKVSA